MRGLRAFVTRLHPLADRSMRFTRLRGHRPCGDHPRRSIVVPPPRGPPMNTRTIAVAALVIAVLLLLFLVVLPNS